MPRRALTGLWLAAACSSSQAAPTLLAVRAEPAGGQCAAGGLAVDVGGDADGNGVLDADEIEATSYDCAPAPAEPPTELTGSLTLHDPAEAARFAKLRKLTGQLRIQGTGAIELPALEEAGAIACVTLEQGTLALPALRVAELVTSTRDCPLPTLPALASARQISLAARAADDYTLPALASVDRLRVEGPEALHAPALTTVTTQLSSTTATLLDLPALVTGHGIIVGIDRRLVAPHLRDATLSFRGNSQLTELAFPELETGSLELSAMPALTQVSLPRFASGSFSLFGTQALTTLALPALASATTVSISSTANLATIDLGRLTSASSLQVSDNVHLTLLSAPQLTSLEQLRVTGNPQLPTCQAEAIAARSGAAATIRDNGTGSCP